MSKGIEYVENPMFSAYDEAVLKDESINLLEYVKITPDTPANNPQLIFRNQDKSNWYLPSEAFLELTLDCKDFRKSDGVAAPNQANVALDPNDDIALINNGWHLFSDARLRANQQEIEFKRLVGEGSTILSVVNYSQDYSSSVASMSYWHPDNGTNGVNADATTPNITSLANLENINLGQRSRVIRKVAGTNAGDFRYTILLKLSEAFGFLRDVHIPFIGIQWELDLNRNSNMSQLLFGSQTPAVPITNGTITFLNGGCKLWMPRVKPSLETERRILSKFESGETHPLAWREYKVHNSGELENEVHFDIPSMTNKPAMVYVAFKRIDQGTSTLRNYGVYPNLNLKQIYLEINGKRYPENPIDCDYATNSYARAYLQLMATNAKCDASNCDMGSVLSYQNFKENYAIYAIDVSKTDPSIYENVNITQIRLFASFDGAIIPKQAYAVVEADRMAKVVGSNGQLSIVF